MSDMTKILLYTMDEERRKRILTVCRLEKVAVREICTGELDQKISVLAGMEEGVVSCQQPDEVWVPECEIMLLCGFSRKKITEFLAKFRAMGLSGEGIRAALTESNREWSFRMLAQELIAEHTAMNG